MPYPIAIYMLLPASLRCLSFMFYRQPVCASLCSRSLSASPPSLSSTRICTCTSHPHLQSPVLRTTNAPASRLLRPRTAFGPWFSMHCGGTPFSDLPDTQALRLTRGTSKAAAPLPPSSFLLHI
ncbi:hypothetical protein C8Q73DRAFT_515943 [Cubamyces lactineus]|nr:hypothetical protein C8Q73DRAFT_515943 [Cubamyces lactineus]